MTTTADRLNWLIQNQVCTRVASASDMIGYPCADCGHAIVVHMGVDVCVVCELQAELRNLRASRSDGEHRPADPGGEEAGGGERGVQARGQHERTSG